MVKKIMLPQEIETFYIIPTIRKNMAIFMKERGIKQKKIAELFGIKDAAVSQYLSDKRGSKIKFDSKILKDIKAASLRIKDNRTMIKEVQGVIKTLRKTRMLCEFCKKFGNVPKGCNYKEMCC